MHYFLTSSFTHLKNLHFGVNSLKQVGNPGLVRVGDEGLPKMVGTHQFHKMRHAFIVDFIENIIEQQDGSNAGRLLDILEMRQFEGNEKRLLLTLRSKSLHRKVIDFKFQIVFMNACRCALCPAIGIDGFLEDGLQIGFMQTADILDLRRFGIAADFTVNLL